MNFATLTYALFLLVVVVAYWLIPSRAGRWFLIGASLVFYGSWNPIYVPGFVFLIKYLDWPGFEQVRLDVLATLTTATGVAIVDPVSFGPWWGDGSSRDVNHLSREGAPLFVQQLMVGPEFRDPIVERLRR